MNKTYVSTRNHQDQINFYQAIVQGIGDDGDIESVESGGLWERRG